jgi:hypothetical protein
MQCTNGNTLSGGTIVLDGRHPAFILFLAGTAYAFS